MAQISVPIQVNLPDNWADIFMDRLKQDDTLKKELLKALEYDRNQYKQGEWDMFCRITSVWHGKEYYFEQENGTIYSRESGKYLKSRDEAIKEFLETIGE